MTTKIITWEKKSHVVLRQNLVGGRFCQFCIIILARSFPPLFRSHYLQWYIITRKDRFPLGRIFREERNFLLFKDQLAESGRQKTKEIIGLRGKFGLVENSHNTR